MHEYSSDAPDRRKIPLTLAGIAVALAYLIFLASGPAGIPAPWWLWLEPPSLAGLYWALHELFDRKLWRANVLGWRPSQIRDLRGTWVGTLTSSHAPEREIPLVLWISQTWTRLSVRVETAQSASHSVAAAVLTNEAAEPGLTYQYVNDPKPLAATRTMHPHRGTATFHFGVDENALDGDYYTGRGRENVGAIRLLRTSTGLLTKEQALARPDADRFDASPREAQK